MSGPLAKAALVQYPPNDPQHPAVTVFQYNPESMVHTWSQQEPYSRAGAESVNPLAVPGTPGETFAFTIYLDADDDVVSTVSSLKQAAQQSGVGARLAALEMLLYPEEGSGPSGSSSGGLVGAVTFGSGDKRSTYRLPNSALPVVLFYWNSNRVVPVRVSSLSITETLYDENLNARHAQAQLSLRVLTPEELAAAKPTPGSAVGLAVTAYNQTLSTRRRWAASNTGAPSGTIASKLPH